MIEVLQLPSGHSAVTMDNQMVVTFNANDVSPLVSASILIQVSENLRRITDQSINTPAMKQPAEGWSWKDILTERSIAIALQLKSALAVVAAGGMTIVMNDAEDGFLIDSEEDVNTREFSGVTSHVYDTSEQAIMAAYAYMQSLPNQVSESSAPAM